MINRRSIESVEASTFSKQFRKPLYDSYCFSNIPGTIEQLLCGDTELPTLPPDVLGNLSTSYDKVVLLFIDGFGWRFFDAYKEKHPFLNRIVAQGVASKITSQFPSTTAAHVTTIHTGQSVGESGVFEWFYYEPKLDAMIAPLLFSFAGDKERHTLQAVDASPQDLYPTSTFYQRLTSRGIRSSLYQSRDFTPSPYNDVVTAGVETILPARTVSEALTSLARALIAEKGKAYFHLYFDQIDGIGHQYGPSTAQFEAEVDTFFTTLERIFYSSVAGKCGKTLLLMTADHGQTEVDPKTTIYLNREIPDITSWIRANRTGKLLAPGGSCRDLFLYIKDEYLAKAHEALTKLLEGRAEVHRVDELMRQGLFGSAPGELLKSRVGNLCILPYEHESVWWWEEGRFEQRFYGHHGGLTPAEVESIFLALPLTS
jgi:hypothetical protein